MSVNGSGKDLMDVDQVGVFYIYLSKAKMDDGRSLVLETYNQKISCSPAQA